MARWARRDDSCSLINKHPGRAGRQEEGPGLLFLPSHNLRSLRAPPCVKLNCHAMLSLAQVYLAT